MELKLGRCLVENVGGFTVGKVMEWEITEFSKDHVKITMHVDAFGKSNAQSWIERKDFNDKKFKIIEYLPYEGEQKEEPIKEVVVEKKYPKTYTDCFKQEFYELAKYNVERNKKPHLLMKILALVNVFNDGKKFKDTEIDHKGRWISLMDANPLTDYIQCTATLGITTTDFGIRFKDIHALNKFKAVPEFKQMVIDFYTKD
jgi:hypothetical protein